MQFPMHYVGSGRPYEDIFTPIPAPAFRRNFMLEELPDTASLLVSGLGYYRVFVNGCEITRGHLSPYTANPDDILPFDRYEIAEHLRKGRNTLAFLLGNGMLNAIGGYIWDLEKTAYRSTPLLAFRCEMKAGERELALESDSDVLWHDSPILSNDLRIGEVYDARLADDMWCSPALDDAHWAHAVILPTPRGERRIVEAEPIRVEREISPVAIWREDDAYIYDFGVNLSGVPRIAIKGERGQTVTCYFGEWVDENGRFYRENLHFVSREEYQRAGYPAYSQRIVLTCSGENDVYTPSFCYMGFRYARVEGLREEQATESLMTFCVMHSDIAERGSFETSDTTLAALQRMTRNSDLANFFWFPTDCPHREKNGWTADAALSSVHMLLNLAPEASYREWLRHIRCAMREDGALPGIVPTGGWGFEWGNGPAWDAVLTELPFEMLRYRGDAATARENAAAILRYLHYIKTRTRKDGLIAIGLGDWCAPIEPYQCTLEFTDTTMCLDISRKAAHMFRALGMEEEAVYADSLARGYLSALREHMLDLSTMTAYGRCQSAQAMAIYYGIFTPAESAEAFRVLLDIIREDGEKTLTGVLGVRVLFRVLAEYGEYDLAYRMITREEAPSYGNWVKLGLTTLAEDMIEKVECGHPEITSLNHHFFGDISAWFIECLAGIRYNPNASDITRVDIKPGFPSAMRDAAAHFDSPIGKISSAWKRKEDGSGFLLSVSVPQGAQGRIVLPRGVRFAEGLAGYRALASGEYELVFG